MLFFNFNLSRSKYYNYAEFTVTWSNDFEYLFFKPQVNYSLCYWRYDIYN